MHHGINLTSIPIMAFNRITALRKTGILRMMRSSYRQFTETALGFSMTLLNAGQLSVCQLQPAVRSSSPVSKVLSCPLNAFSLACHR